MLTLWIKHLVCKGFKITISNSAQGLLFVLSLHKITSLHFLLDILFYFDPNQNVLNLNKLWDFPATDDSAEYKQTSLTPFKENHINVPNSFPGL